MAEARPRIVAVVQARLGSTRLPGKVLLDLAGRPLLAWVLERLRRARSVDEVRLAIPDAAADAPLAALAGRLGVPVTRGSESDVLGRYLAAARESSAAHVVRVTSDCPFIDPELVDALVAHHLRTGADYSSNCRPPSWPRGFDAEIAGRAALDRAGRETRDAYDREHVMPYLYREPGRFRVSHLPAPAALRRPDLRVCVDTEADLRAVRAVAAGFGGRDDFGAAEIIGWLAAHPETAALNREVGQKALCKTAFWIGWGSRIGTGHLARARAIAGALAGREALSRAFCAASPPAAPEPRDFPELRLEPLAVRDPAEFVGRLIAAARAFGAGCVLVDCYEARAENLAALRAAGFLVAAIDDFGVRLPADIIVNRDVRADPKIYEPLVPGGRVLAGPAYFPARAEMLRAAEARRAAPAGARRLLVTFGGSDPAGLSVPVAAELLKLPPPVEVELVLGPLAGERPARAARELAAQSGGRLILTEAPDSLAESCVRADVAVSAGGETAFELALCGVPAVIVAVAGHQAERSAALARAGVCRYLGEAGQAASAEIAAAAAGLLADAAARAAMSAAGRRLVDGRGAERIAAALVERLLGTDEGHKQ